MGRKRYTEEECLLALKKAVEELGDAPTMQEYNSMNISPSAQVISGRVGSWRLALAKVGAERDTRRSYTEEYCLNTIRNLAEDLGEEPSVSQYREHGCRPSLSAISSMFGSWTAAKEEADVVDYGEDQSAAKEVEEFFDQLEDAEYVRE